MNKRPNHLEAELRSMRPAPLRAALVSRIGEAIHDDSPSPWAQRRLLGAIWAGSLAACVIVTMLMLPNELPAMPSVPLHVSTNNTNADTPTFALALAGPKWIDLEK